MSAKPLIMFTMDCQECGQNVPIRQRHTFVDCALYTTDHLQGDPLPDRYARAMAEELRELRQATPA